MSLAAFSAIVFAVAGIVCLVSFTHIMYVLIKNVDIFTSDGKLKSQVDAVIDNAKWYSNIAFYVLTPSFYVAVGGLLLAIGAAIAGA